MELPISEIQIFVSCPGDVNFEKDLLVKAVESVNRVVRDELRVVFTVKDYEDLIVEYGKRSQQTINDAFASYHIYVGIMWMRFGSPTGELNPETNSQFLSGTEEEFFIATKKAETQKISILFFFKDPIFTGSTEEEVNQLLLVTKFKLKIRGNSVNSFKQSDGGLEFSQKIYEKLLKYAFQYRKEQNIQVKHEILSSDVLDISETESRSTAFASEIENLPEYLPRTLTQELFEGEQIHQIIYNKSNGHSLPELVEFEKRIIVLGNAGSGKSIELKKLVEYYQSNNTQFLPVYINLRNFSGNDLKSYLPDNWYSVDQSIFLLVLDGLDEVDSALFKAAVQEIESFSSLHPEVSIVISCRTNFYGVASEGGVSSLKGYKVYHLNDLNFEDVSSYVDKLFPSISTDDFIFDANRYGYGQLITVPFYLHNLLKEYSINLSFNASRAEIFNRIFDNLFLFDQNHIVEVGQGSIFDKSTVIANLQKIAISMELKGSSELDEKFIIDIVGSQDQFEVLRYCSGFKKVYGSTHTWTFQHNNLKEYLAASFLMKMSPTTVLDLIVTTDKQRIQPVWVNTLSFYISLANNSETTLLIDWLVEHDPEILIRFEPDKIDISVREAIFFKVFGFYKERNLWLNSNKFKNWDLIFFIHSQKILDFLIENIISNTSRRNLVNCLTLLESFGPYISNDQKLKIENILCELYESHPLDNYVISCIIDVFYELKIHSVDRIEMLITTLIDSNDSGIRNSLYKLILGSKQTDKYIEYLLGGFIIDRDKDGEIRFGDEGWNLKRAVTSVSSFSAVLSVINFFIDQAEERVIEAPYYATDILQNIVDKSIVFYSLHSILYETILRFLKVCVKNHYIDDLSILSTFFKGTLTDSRALIEVYKDKQVDDVDKLRILKVLANKNSLSAVFKNYDSHDLTNEDIRSIHKLLIIALGAKADLVGWFEKAFSTKSNMELPKYSFNTWEEEREKVDYETLNLFFSTKKLKDEVVNIFNAIEKDSITRQDFQDFFKSEIQKEIIYSQFSVAIINHFLRRNNARLIDIVNWFNSDKYLEYCIRKIYELLKRKDSLKVTDEQIEFIRNWVTKKMQITDVRNVFLSKEDGQYANVNKGDVDMLWFFIKRYRLESNNTKLYEFTWYREINNRHDEGLAVLNYLEQIFGKEIICNQVNKNLHSGIDVTFIWECNARYAIKNSISESYKTIISDCLSISHRDFIRSSIISEYYNHTKNASDLIYLINNIHSSEVIWTCINLLYDDGEYLNFVLDYCDNILSKIEANVHDKIKAADYLAKMNNRRGLCNLINQVLLYSNDTALSALRYNNTYNNIDGLDPYIILLEFGLINKITLNEFERLDGIALDGVKRIGISSKHNFEKVQDRLQMLISKYPKDMVDPQFIHFTLQSIEQTFYQSENTSISDEDILKKMEFLQHVKI